jgi:hypothetical protein
MSTPLMADLLRAAAAENPGLEAYVHDDKRCRLPGWFDRAADAFATSSPRLWRASTANVVLPVVP